MKARTGRAVAGTAAVLAALGAGASLGAAAPKAPAAASCPGLAHARSQLAKFMRVPRFVAPGPPVQASKVRGKSLYLIPATSAIPFNDIIDKSVARVGKRLGLKVTVFPTLGQSSQWVQGMNQAIANHASVIVLFAIDPRLLQPQILAAKRAGIPVISAIVYDDGDARLAHPLRAPNLAAIVTAPFAQSARLTADYAIVKTGCKANVVGVQAAEFVNFKYQVGGMTDELKRYCPACKYTVINVPAVDWASKMQTDVQAAFAKDPNVNWTIPLVDGMAQYVLPAITASGKRGKVGVSTFNGTPFALKDVKDGTIDMNVGENLDWKGWAIVDQAMRVMLHMKPVATERTPLRVFDRTNVGQTGNPPTFNKGYGTAYIAGYEKLWGLR